MSGTNSLFTKQTLLFANSPGVSIITDAQFGILNLVAVSGQLNQDMCQEFVFTVDCSGSMSDSCSDGRTKMQHIIHTLKNMILYFKENSVQASITIHAFDHKIYKIIERTFITEENYAGIITKIDQITPRGSTDIEKALESSKEMIMRIKSEFPTHNISHIFMTDGEVTAGNGNPDFLSEIVDRSVTNAFIGFGIQHDTVLLNTLGSGKNSGYYFVDKLENCGLVYGEILHSILYKLLDDVVISVENGLIYDFKNNSWVETLCVGQIAYENDKIYHITSSRAEDCVVTFSGKNIGGDLADIVFTVTSRKQEEREQEQEEREQEKEEDLTKYMYRQRTLEYLYKANDYLKRKNSLNINNSDDLFMFAEQNVPESFKEEEKSLKEQLKTFITEMKQYMSDKGLTNDGFMKNLCDDIYICYKTLGNRFGAMYVAARQTSQGVQRAYTVRHTPDDDDTNNIDNIIDNNNYVNDDNTIWLQRGSINASNNDDELCHELSDFSEAPYVTPTSAGLMRDISCGSETEEP
jgi:uncharacterized protein YegL